MKIGISVQIIVCFLAVAVGPPCLLAQKPASSLIDRGTSTKNNPEPGDAEPNSAVLGVIAPEIWGAKADNQNNDTEAVQACIDASSTRHIVCVLRPASGYYLVSHLVLRNSTHLLGSSAMNSVRIRSNYDGDVFTIDDGPVQGITLEGFDVMLDPLLSHQRAFHIEATNKGHNFAGGGLWDSTFRDIEVDGAAQECIWLEGGGGGDYKYMLPIQFIDFYHFNCNGARRIHPGSLIRMTGQVAQIQFYGGQTNGDGDFSHYKNPLITIENKTSGLNDAPGNIAFRGYTIQSGAIGLDVKYGRTVLFEAGWIEGVGTPFVLAWTSGLVIAGNHIANSGTTDGVLKALSRVSGAMRDNEIQWSPGHTPASLAVCGADDTLSFSDNTDNAALVTSNCVTQRYSSAAVLNLFGRTAYITGDSGRTPIRQLSAPVAPGETVSLVAGGASIALSTGGNISLGAYKTPLIIASGAIVTLRKFDFGLVWGVESVSQVQVRDKPSELGPGASASP